MTRHAYARAQQAGIAVGPLLAKAGLTERQVRDRSVRINARQLIPQSRRSGHRRSGSRLSHRADLRPRAALLCGSLIEEEDACQRIAHLKALRLQVEAEIATLEEAPKIITLHPAILDRHVEMVDALAKTCCRAR
jgi:hypothetical protein